MTTYRTYTDLELAALLGQGDERAFDHLFRKFYPALCFFARRYVPVPGLAEEVVQDIMFKLWQRHKDFNDFNSVKSFLYISIKHACIDKAESERRKLNRDNNWYLQQDHLEHNIEEHMIQSEVLMEISQAIEMLPGQCRKIMKMSYEQGMSGKEIADIMQLTVSTVNNQKARGVLLLRKALSYKALVTLFALFHADLFN